MRCVLQVFLSGLLVAALCGWAAAEIIVANDAGHVWVLNDNLTTKADDFFAGVQDVSGLKDGSVLLATSAYGGSLLVRNPATLGYITSGTGFGTFSTTGVMGLKSGNILAGNHEGYLYVRTPDTGGLYGGPSFGSVNSVGELPNGKVVAVNSDGTVMIRNSDTSWFATGIGFGTSVHVEGLSTGNVLVGNAEGYAYVRSGNDLSYLCGGAGYGVVTALAEFANGKIAAVNDTGYLRVRNPDMSAYWDGGGFGAVPEMAALPNGTMAVPNTSGVLRLVDINGNVTGYQAGFGTVVSVAYLTPVPEPSALVLLTIALMGLLTYAWRKRGLRRTMTAWRRMPVRCRRPPPWKIFFGNVIMRRLMQMLLSGLIVAALYGPVSAEIIVANSAGTVWNLNDDLTTKVKSIDGWFPGTVDVSGLANGNVLIASNHNSGTLWLRDRDLGYIATDSSYGPLATGAVTGMKSGDILLGNQWGSLMTRHSDLSAYRSEGGHGDVYGSVTELTNGNVAGTSEIGSGYLVLHDSSLSRILSVGSWGTGLHVAGLSTGNVLASNSSGNLRVLSGSDLSYVYGSDGYLPISAIAEFSNGKVAVTNTSGRLFVRNGDLTSVATDDGYGTVSEMAAMPNGLMIVASADQGTVRLVDSNAHVVLNQAGFGTIVSVAYLMPLPEPSALVLLTTALPGLLAYAWRKRK